MRSSFESRFNKHMSDFRNRNYENPTNLSKYICLKETYLVSIIMLSPEGSTLNKRVL